MVFGFTSISGADDWPNFLGPTFDGVSTERIENRNWRAKPPKLLWKNEIGEMGFAGPSVVGDMVFYMDHKEGKDIVRAVRIGSGEKIWTFEYDEKIAPKKGQSGATPTYDEGRLYTLGRSGHLHCLNAMTGELNWDRNIVSDFRGNRPKMGISGSPLIDGNNLILLPGGEKGVVALDKETGRQRWRGGGAYPNGYATPVVATLNGKRQYIVFTGGGPVGVDPRRGKVLWHKPWISIPDFHASCPRIVGENKVFIGSGYSHGSTVFKVDGTNTKTIWTNAEIRTPLSTPILFKKHLYCSTTRGVLMCVDPLSGKIRWKQDGFTRGGIIMVDNLLIGVGGSTGTIMLIQPDTRGYREYSRHTPFRISTKRPGFWANPVYANGHLFIRFEDYFACIKI